MSAGGVSPVNSCANISNYVRVGPFHLRLGLFYLWLVFVAYGKLAWSFFTSGCNSVSFLRTVEICLVFFTYGFPCSEIGSGPSCLALLSAISKKTNSK